VVFELADFPTSVVSLSSMEFMIVWERVIAGHFSRPPLALVCLLVQRMPDGTYQLVLPPLPPDRLLVGVMWVTPLEFTYLAALYMDDYVMRRVGQHYH
jgi:hypothetical protein